MSEFQNKKDLNWKEILDPEQYNIMREEGTESPGSSSLNEERGHIIAQHVIALFLNLKKNMKAEVVGHLFLRVNLMHLTLKQTIILDMLEQNIIVENAEVITDIYLMTAHNQRVKDIVIMERH